MHWLAMESMPDILQLLSPEMGKTAHSEILPDLTRREHRIIGIDSHYRITPTQKNGNTAHEKTDTLPATLSALLQEYSIAEGFRWRSSRFGKIRRRRSAATACFSCCVWPETGRGRYTSFSSVPGWRQIIPGRPGCTGSWFAAKCSATPFFRVNNDPVFFCRSPFGWSHCWRHSPVMTIPVRLINTVIPHWKP